jgi:hypothetical protein
MLLVFVQHEEVEGALIFVFALLLLLTVRNPNGQIAQR